MIPDYMDRKHDYSFARDRQLQNKLLAADDIFDQSQLTSTVVSAPRPSNLRDFKGSEVTGWNPDKVVLRKADNDNVLSKPRTSVGTREGLLTRDRSRRDLHDSSYAFYHYPESHRYIEQYRREHTCTDSTNSATTRNEFLELQRFYAYRSQTGSLYTHPTTVGYVPQSHAAARREQTVLPHRNSDPSLRSASRYKLSPSFHVRSEQDLSKEIDQTEPGLLQVGANTGLSSKMAIHAVSKTPIPKVPTKVTVPTNQSPISASLNKTVKAGRKTGSPKTTSVAAWENGVRTMRTLDTLACVARPGDKTQGNLAWLTIQVAASRKDSSEVGLSAGHWAHMTEQSAPPTPERDGHPAHFSSPGQILVDHCHGAICPSERVHSPWEAFHRIPQEGDTSSYAAETGRHPGEALQSPKKHLPTVSRSKAPASTFSSSSVRNLSSLSSTSSNAPPPKWESKASPQTGVPTGLMSSADSSRMLGDVASRPFHSKGMWNVSRGPFRGSREKLLQRMQAAALSMAQGESREQAAREPCRWDISEGLSNPLSVLSIRSARKREGSRGKLVLVERRDGVTLAPTRPGCGRDHTDISSGGTGGNDGQGGEDRVPWQDCEEDMDSSPLESRDSSLEVIISSQEDVGQNEDSVGQEDLNSSREQQGPHCGVTRPRQGDREDCSHTVDGKSVDSRRGHRSSQRSNNSRHNIYIHNRSDLQILNMRPSRTTNPALLERGAEDTHVEQHTFDEGDVTESDSATSISQKTGHEPITSPLTSRVHDGNFLLNFPPQLSHTQFSNGGTPKETGPGHIQGQSCLNPHPADLKDKTEDRKREIGVSLDTQRPQQQTGAAAQTYTPTHQQGAASEECQTVSHGLQRPSSLCRDVPDDIQESLAKRQPPCTSLQDAGHVEWEEKTTAPGTHSSPDGEDHTMLTTGESSGFFGSSGSHSHRHTQALSRLQRQRTVMMKASNSSLHAISSPRQHGSPRKGVPFPGTHRGALLVYHNDVNRMMVVGSQCTHRPSTSLSRTPFPAESGPASRSSLVTASRSAGPYRQTRSLRHNH